MKEKITLRIEKDQKEEFNKLQMILSLMNIDHKLEHQGSFYKDEILVIEFDTQEIYRKLHRGRGRKKKQINRSFFKVSDAEAMMRTIGAAKTADELGVSRATLYRRIKEAKEHEEEYLRIV